jgi:hypothetical protein
METIWYGNLFYLALADRAGRGAGAVRRGGKIPKLMRDMGQGINAFKKGLKEEGKKDKDLADADQTAIEQDTVTASTASEKQDAKTVKG